MEETSPTRIWSTVAQRWVEIPPNRCDFAEMLETFAAEQCTEVLSSPTHILLNQKIILLTDKFFEILSKTPKAHCYLMNPKATHICLFPTYADWYERLRRAGIKLTGPQLYIPPPPPPPPSPAPPESKYQELNGLLLGEFLEEE